MIEIRRNRFKAHEHSKILESHIPAIAENCIKSLLKTEKTNENQPAEHSSFDVLFY